MEAEAQSIEALARPLIAQCRREIAAAWAQIEAAKDMLRRTRWLLARWAEQSQEQNQVEAPRESERLARSNRSEAARMGMFVFVPELPTQPSHRARLTGRAARASA